MEKIVEYSNACIPGGGGRYIETTDGKKAVTDIRMLGCPDELASSIEKRNADRKGTAPSSDLKAQLDTFKNTILSA